jgi:hypothetical protein
MKSWRFISCAICLFAICHFVITGCDGGADGGASAHSVDSSKYLDELTEAEIQALCEESMELQGGEGTKDCGEDREVTVRSVDECAAGYHEADLVPHCQLSVVYDCYDAMGWDACKLLDTPECGPLLECVD